jgi:signal peptidase
MEAIVALWVELKAHPGPFHLVMRGSSMWPAAPEGSLMSVTPCPIRSLSPGEMVTFKIGRRIITHRVHRVLADGRVCAWGDSILTADPPLGDDDVLGRAEVLRRGPLFKGRPRIRLTLRRLLAELARRRATD